MKNRYTRLLSPLWQCIGLLWLTLGSVAAQSYQMPVTGSVTVNTCGGTIYDDGGAAGDYSADANGVTTLVPGVSGNRIRLQFTAFATEPYYDRLFVFDGASTSAPLLGIYEGTTIPGVLQATNSSGALTLRFVSDGAGNFAGFAAGISCVPAAPLPDLTIQFPNLSPQATVAGGMVAANASVRNLSVTAAPNTTIGFYLSTNQSLDANDVLLNAQSAGTVFGNSSNSTFANLTIPANTATGSYFVLYVADHMNDISESDETNNLAAVALSIVPPGVDLVIQNAAAQPNNTAPGNVLNLSCVIFNQGTTVALSSSVGYYLSTNQTLDANDQLLTSVTGGNLTAGFGSSRFATATLPSTLTPGTYYMLFVADHLNAVSETNEQNNVASVLLTVSAPSVDLVVQQPFSPATATAGSSISINANIVNQGNTQASSSALGFYLSTDQALDANDVLLATAPGGVLGGGLSSYRSAFPVLSTNLTPGTYYLLFVADPQNQVAETNEQNNLAVRTLTLVTPTVDLVVQQPGVPFNATAGATISAFNYIFNQGNAPAGAFGTGYYFSTNTTLDASDVLIGQMSNTGLTANNFLSNNASLVVPATATPGTYYVLFVADYLNQVVESNEQNNVSFQTLSVVLPSVDLVVQQPGISPFSTAPGMSVNTFSYIFNQGNTAASSSSVGYYLSANQTLDANDVLLGQTPGGNLAGGQWGSRNGSVTIPANTAPGSYFMLFVADHLNVVNETNEQNNVAPLAFTVLTPGVDLQLAQPGLARQSVSAGGNVNAGTGIVNAGTTSASSSNVGFYLSTDNTLSANDVLLTTATGGMLWAGGSEFRSANLIIPAATAPGNYHILFVADPLNLVVETNEQNNLAALPLTVLAPFAGTVVPFSGSSTITTCSTTVYDHGGTDDYSDNANGSLTILPSTTGARIRITLTSFLLEQGYDYLTVYDGTSSMAPQLGRYTGSSGAGVVLTATNSSGALTLVFTTDGSVVLPGFEAAVTCVTGGSNPGMPDLVMLQPTTSSTNLMAGATVTLGATIRNQGTSDASSSTFGFYFSTNTVFDASDVLIGTSTGGVLGAGQQAPRSSIYTVPPSAVGTYYLLAVADPLNAVSESNEQNNVAVFATPITVNAGSIDIVVSQPRVFSSPAAAGGTVNLTCFNQNTGTVTAPGHDMGVFLSTDATFSTNDVLLNYTSVSSMAPGFGTTRSINNVVIPRTTPLGTYYVIFVADLLNQVIETNKQNNVAVTQLLIDRTLPVREQAGGYAIDVFPNPTSTSTVAVQFAGAGVNTTAELTLYNSLGQKISQQQLDLRSTAATATFSTGQLSRGVYILHAVGKGLNVTRRIVVE